MMYDLHVTSHFRTDVQFMHRLKKNAQPLPDEKVKDYPKLVAFFKLLATEFKQHVCVVMIWLNLHQVLVVTYNTLNRLTNILK